jgi:hypothetical protein
MEPSVVVALIAAALVALLVAGQQPAPVPEPAPVRVDDDNFHSALRRG